MKCSFFSFFLRYLDLRGEGGSLEICILIVLIDFDVGSKQIYGEYDCNIYLLNK